MNVDIDLSSISPATYNIRDSAMILTFTFSTDIPNADTNCGAYVFEAINSENGTPINSNIFTLMQTGMI